MSAPQATVVIVPRERFSMAIESLDSVLRHTGPEIPVVYVDGGSPAKVRRILERRAAERGIRLVGGPHYLSPNEARNLGLEHVSTRHVVFLDNDCLVEQGWVDRLVRCAEETGAAAVIPVLCWENGLVHTAGNTMSIGVEDGQRRLRYGLVHEEEPLEAVRGKLRRRRIDAVEFHCVLVRVEFLGKTGPFDENMLSTREHCDFSLELREAGGEIYLEPDVVVCCVRSPSLEWREIPYYLLRWSPQWNEASLRRLDEKWRLEDDYVDLTRTWLEPVRALALDGLRRRLLGVFGSKAGMAITDMAERVLIRLAMSRRAPGRVSGGSPRS